MTCDESRNLFVESLYGELNAAAAQALDEHLAGCTACSAEFRSLREALSVMDRHTVAEPTDREWNGLRRKLSRGIVQEEPRTAIPAFRPAWAYGIAAVLLISAGLYIGAVVFSTHGGSPAPQREVASAPLEPPPDSTTLEALAYLERSQNLLIGLSNLDAEHHDALDLRGRQRTSRSLIDQGNTLTVALNKPDQQLLRRLIADLQIILLQLANIELKTGEPAVELVRKGMDSKSILLKINLEQLRAAARQQSKENLQKQNRNL